LYINKYCSHPGFRTRDEPELKNLDGNGLFTLTDTVQFTLVNKIPQGVSQNQRLARKAFMTRWSFQGAILPNLDTTGSIVRCILLYDKSADGAALTSADIFADPLVPGTSFPNLAFKERFVWIWDYRKTMGVFINTPNTLHTYRGLAWAIGANSNGDIVKSLGIKGTSPQQSVPTRQLAAISSAFNPGTIATVPTTLPGLNIITYSGTGASAEYESMDLPWKDQDDGDTSNTITTYATGGKTVKNVDYVTDLKIDVIYKNLFTGDIDDIESGALWFITCGNDTTNKYVLGGNWRLRYSDD